MPASNNMQQRRPQQQSASHHHQKGGHRHAGHVHSNATSDVVEVYAPHFAALYKIPAHDVFHIPPAHLNVTRLVLCAHFAPDAPCPVGNRCKFVHADVSHAQVASIHINYAYKSLNDVEYDCYPEGHILNVSQPNGKAPVVAIPSQCVLRTRALEVAAERQQAQGASAEPQQFRLSHCAHYYFNRACHQGHNCQFIHAVYLDPRATRHQRAPVPHLQTAPVSPHVEMISQPEESSLSLTAEELVDIHAITPQRSNSRYYATPSDDGETSSHEDDLAVLKSAVSARPAAPETTTPPTHGSAASCRGSASRYHYNPYDQRTAIVCM